MKRSILGILIVCIGMVGCVNDSKIDKIIRAKQMVKNMVNYPDTLSFHEFSTEVSGNTVTLTFTCKNGFGVPETHTVNIVVN